MAHNNTALTPARAFVTEHPWMTFFLVLAGLKTVETVIRGYGPPASGLFYSTVPERNERGDYGTSVTATTGGRIR
jgi:hypothetical protein